MSASVAQQQMFINEIGYIIQEEAKARGYHVCSPIIAQACCESAYGTSSLGYKWHNYFGLKCGKYWEGKSVNLSTKEEYTAGTLTTTRDNFRVFDNIEEGVKGYFEFISTKRYSNLKDALTPKEYLEFIKADGYATSSAYVSTNLGIISRHDLERFDWEEERISYPIPARLLKKGCKGEDVKWLQYELLRRNYDVGVIDGIFGIKTEKALKSFQYDHFVDGICGPLTINAFL